jgi:integrase
MGNLPQDLQDIELNEVTFGECLQLYKTALETKEVRNSNGNPLSNETIKSRLKALSVLMALKSIQKEKVNQKGFCRVLIKSLDGYERSSANVWLYYCKAAINFAFELKDLPLPVLKLKVTVPEKPVYVLNAEEISYMINNYYAIKESLAAFNQRAILDYWIVGLLTVARARDMHTWKSENFDGFELRYTQSKGKNRAKPVFITLPIENELLREIFKTNSDKFGTLLPPLIKPTSDLIKKVAKKIPLFNQEVAVEIKGEMTKVPRYKMLSVHMMRRSGISDMANKGMPDVFIKAASGHTENSSVFKRYVTARTSDMKKAIQQYNKQL